MGASVSFTGKHVVITGGSEGIGLALAREFVSESAHVTLLSRSASKLQQAQASLRVRLQEAQAQLRRIFRLLAACTGIPQLSSLTSPRYAVMCTAVPPVCRHMRQGPACYHACPHGSGSCPITQDT